MDPEPEALEPEALELEEPVVLFEKPRRLLPLPADTIWRPWPSTQPEGKPVWVVSVPLPRLRRDWAWPLWACPLWVCPLWVPA